MQIDTHTIANLARISLTEDEHVSFSKDIQAILSFIDTIQSLTVATQDPTKHSIGMAPLGTVRIDQHLVRPEEYGGEELVQQAPVYDTNFIKVKKILN